MFSGSGRPVGFRNPLVDVPHVPQTQRKWDAFLEQPYCSSISQGASNSQQAVHHRQSSLAWPSQQQHQQHHVLQQQQPDDDAILQLLGGGGDCLNVSSGHGRSSQQQAGLLASTTHLTPPGISAWSQQQQQQQQSNTWVTPQATQQLTAGPGHRHGTHAQSSNVSNQGTAGPPMLTAASRALAEDARGRSAGMVGYVQSPQSSLVPRAILHTPPPPGVAAVHCQTHHHHHQQQQQGYGQQAGSVVAAQGQGQVVAAQLQQPWPSTSQQQQQQQQQQHPGAWSGVSALPQQQQQQQRMQQQGQQARNVQQQVHSAPVQVHHQEQHMYTAADVLVREQHMAGPTQRIGHAPSATAAAAMGVVRGLSTAAAAAAAAAGGDSGTGRSTSSTAGQAKSALALLDRRQAAAPPPPPPPPPPAAAAAAAAGTGGGCDGGWQHLGPHAGDMQQQNQVAAPASGWLQQGQQQAHVFDARRGAGSHQHHQQQQQQQQGGSSHSSSWQAWQQANGPADPGAGLFMPASAAAALSTGTTTAAAATAWSAGEAGARWAHGSINQAQQLPPVYLPAADTWGSGAAAAVAAAVQGSHGASGPKRPAAAVPAAAGGSSGAGPAKRQKGTAGTAGGTTAAGAALAGHSKVSKGATAGKYGGNVTMSITRPGQDVSEEDAEAIAAAVAARGAKQATLQQSLQRAAAAGRDAAAGDLDAGDLDGSDGEGHAGVAAGKGGKATTSMRAEERMKRQRARLKLMRKGGPQLVAKVAAVERARKAAKEQQGAAAAGGASGSASGPASGKRRAAKPPQQTGVRQQQQLLLGGEGQISGVLQQQQGASSKASGSGRGGGSARARKPSGGNGVTSGTSSSAYSEDLQLERLPQDNSIILLDTPSSYEAAHAVLSSCAGYCFGLLLAARSAGAQQYLTSLVGLTKEQQAALKKAAAEQRKASKARTQADSSAAPAAEAGASKDVSMAGFAILPLNGDTDSAPMFVYLLPEHHPQQEQQQQQQQGTGLTLAAQQLLTRCLTSTQCPCLCFDAKTVLVHLQQQQQQRVTVQPLQQQQPYSSNPPQQQQQQQQQQCPSGWVLPPAEALQLVDPWVLGWVLEAQLVQDTKDSSECYGLMQQLARRGLAPQEENCTGLPPLQRLRWQLQAAARLAVEQQQLLQHMQAPQALKVELKVLSVLARMEALGVCCDPGPLQRHHTNIRARLAALAQRAEQLVGHPVNLSSSSQVAVVLYEELQLPVPTGAGSRNSAKTHHTTDEAALQQLAALHELPGLVLEHRCLMNVITKWLESPWVAAVAAEAAQAAAAAAAAAVAAGVGARTSSTGAGVGSLLAGAAVAGILPGAAGGGGGCGCVEEGASSSSGAVVGPGDVPVGVVRCCWSQVGTATGRLSCSGPNLQAVTKYTVQASRAPDAEQTPAGPQQQDAAAPAAASQAPMVLEINIRDAFVAPAGRLLLSADYSQIELRLLAHFSKDAGLQQLLRQAGPAGDVFTAMAARCMKDPATGQLPANARERAKRVTYGIIYGLTPFGLSQQLRDQGVTVAAAELLIDGFLAAFPAVKRFMDSSVAAATQCGWVTTLLGRRRQIGGLQSKDGRERAVAARKVVNTIIQGSAADLIKLAMCAWDDWSHTTSSSSSTSGGAGSTSTAAYTRHSPPVSADATAVANTTNSSSSSSSSSSSAPAARAALIAQIHDELLFEVCAGSVEDPLFQQVAGAVEGIMCGVVALEVPLIINLAAGQRWGSMARWQRQAAWRHVGVGGMCRPQ